MDVLVLVLLPKHGCLLSRPLRGHSLGTAASAPLNYASTEPEGGKHVATKTSSIGASAQIITKSRRAKKLSAAAGRRLHPSALLESRIAPSTAIVAVVAIVVENENYAIARTRQQHEKRVVAQAVKARVILEKAKPLLTQGKKQIPSGLQLGSGDVASTFVAFLRLGETCQRLFLKRHDFLPLPDLICLSQIYLFLTFPISGDLRARTLLRDALVAPALPTTLLFLRKAETAPATRDRIAKSRGTRGRRPPRRNNKQQQGARPRAFGEAPLGMARRGTEHARREIIGEAAMNDGRTDSVLRATASSASYPPRSMVSSGRDGARDVPRVD
uniref:Uncharacterized protein n=1 Tax=Steinernema glaseri TaxID=37863 RepID=A0A1I7YN53_9BILA